MKSKNFNKIFKLGILAMLVAFFGSSCVKSYPGNTDFTGLKPTVLIPEGGPSNFSSGALLFPPTDASDTAFFHLNYASTNVAPQNEVITLKIDQAALDAYNALGGSQFELFPDSIFSFTSTTVTVPKGANYSSLIPLVVYPNKLNLLKNYMLPISISVAPAGSTIATNFQTIYYHTIGNPIAGLYTREWIRYNNLAGTGVPLRDLFSTQVFAPVDGTTISVPSGTGVLYILSFTQVGNVLSNFQVSIDPASVTAVGIKILSGPTIIAANSPTGYYQFNFTYDNLAGGLRNITDKFTKQ